MNHKIAHLRVKIKSLAAEARIIRHEERKTRGLQRHLLGEHRRGTVRRTARHSLLAYACLRGAAYARVEHQDTRKDIDWHLVKGMAKRFGGVEADIDAWIEDAQQTLKNWQTRQQAAA